MIRNPVSQYRTGQSTFVWFGFVLLPRITLFVHTDFVLHYITLRFAFRLFVPLLRITAQPNKTDPERITRRHGGIDIFHSIARAFQVCKVSLRSASSCKRIFINNLAELEDFNKPCAYNFFFSQLLIKKYQKLFVGDG